MRSIEVAVDPPYTVFVGSGLLEGIARGLKHVERICVVADAQVAGLYDHRLEGLEDAPRMLVEGGEQAKDFKTLERVLEFLADMQLDRRSCLVTLGGGSLGDLGGLAASLFKRGISVVHAPTTLLAQVDASVGGKTAINLARGKNLVGTFHQPRAVFADIGTLDTLEETEWCSGLGEVLKTALIDGESMLAHLEDEAAAIVARQPEAVARVVADCVALKARVVAQDPTEEGPRRALNLGHTLGHALEVQGGYGRIPHGVAVAAGIGLALELSRSKGTLADGDLLERTRRCARALGLPFGVAELAEHSGCQFDVDELLRLVDQDKKGGAGDARFVLIRGAGDLVLDVPVTRQEMCAVLSS